MRNSLRLVYYFIVPLVMGLALTYATRYVTWGFANAGGFPLIWYEEFGAEKSPAYQYLSFVEDVIFWCVIIVVIVFIVSHALVRARLS
jgi:ABC-type branched-subunit amino acid transport system permease subunit